MKSLMRSRLKALLVTLALGVSTLSALFEPTVAAGRAEPRLDPEVLRFLKISREPTERLLVIIHIRVADFSEPSRFRGHSGMVSRFLRIRAQKTMSRVTGILGEPTRNLPAFIEIWAANVVVATVDRGTLSQLLDLDEVEAVELHRVRRLKPAPEMAAPPPIGGVEWSLAETGCDRVWKDFGVTGKEVRVGIIDSGIMPDHPDLVGRTADFRDFCLTPGGTACAPYDDLGHGTHCAGTLCGGNALGPSIGAAPGVKLLVAKAFGRMATAGDATLLGAMQWMIDPDDDPDTDDAPALVSNSWGLSSGGSAAYGKMVMAWKRAGILPVFAAGNTGPENETITLPGNRSEALSVGAFDTNGSIAEFSARGPVKLDGTTITKPDMTAPGVGISSADYRGGRRALKGTSMACPHLAGVIALMLEANPAIDHRDILSILATTAKDRGLPGKDNSYGHGLVDAHAAVSECLSAGKINFESPDPTWPAPKGCTDHIVDAMAFQDMLAREVNDFIASIEQIGSRKERGGIFVERDALILESLASALESYRERLVYLAFHHDSKLVRNLIARLDAIETVIENPPSMKTPSRSTDIPGRFSRDPFGVISDSLTGLQWIEGPDLPTSWEQAQAWSASLSKGWRTPTLDELEALYLPHSNRRGIYGDPLCIDETFKRESAYCLWSVERYPGTAWLYDFSRGYAHWIDVYMPGRFDRAVAVRDKGAR